MKVFTTVNQLHRVRVGWLLTIFSILFITFTISMMPPVHSAIAQPLLPPAVYYGWITPTVGFAPTAGMPVVALINGVSCGQTTVQPKDGRLAYTIHVLAENPVLPSNGCGAITRTVSFQVGNWTMEHSRLWSNRQAWFHSLTQVRVQASSADLEYTLYLPMIIQ
jgi:hypothetical protein